MSKQSNQCLNLIIRWGGTLLSIGILIYLLSRIGWQEAWRTIRQLTVWRILFVLMLVFISRLATFGRWYTLLKDQTPTLSFTDTLKLTFSGEVFAAKSPAEVEWLLLKEAL